MDRVATTEQQPSRTHLIQSALTIVLQYWMIPNLGWPGELYESKLPILRQRIVEDRLRHELHLDKDQKEQRRQALIQRYEREYLYFDSQHLELLQSQIDDETPEKHFNNLQVCL
jgi:hypothetical protein